MSVFGIFQEKILNFTATFLPQFDLISRGPTPFSPLSTVDAASWHNETILKFYGKNAQLTLQII